MFPWETWALPPKNSLFLEEVIFFIKEFFLFHGELAWDQHLIYFSLKKLFPKGN
jgi:hypothetical protein